MLIKTTKHLTNLIRSLSLITILLIISSQVNAERINVGLEPFPPLINEANGGVLIDTLNQLTSHSTLKLDFQLMTYARAKEDLKDGRLQLIGLTPKNHETKEFYQYAQELDWSIDTHVDIFSMQPPPIDPTTFESFTIGTLIGNAEFFSEALAIPLEKFAEVSSLQQLVKMLLKGRIKAIVFERISIALTIQSLNAQGIYYQHLTKIPASLAVQNNEAGSLLKKRLDALLTEENQISSNKNLLFFNGLPLQGEVIINKTDKNDQ